MEKEIHKVLMLPARFLEVVDKEKVRIRIMLDDGIIQEKTMPKELIDDVLNPNYLFVGITTGVNHMQLDVCDANEFNEIFKEKWSEI